MLSEDFVVKKDLLVIAVVEFGYGALVQCCGVSES